MKRYLKIAILNLKILHCEIAAKFYGIIADSCFQIAKTFKAGDR